ncbi:MAG: hypothetical protein WCC66_05915 [Rhizobiaceae bacterium]
MIKTLIAAAALSFVFAGVAGAAEMKECNDETFAMVMKAVEGAEGDAKTMGMKELDMAKEAMGAKNNEECGKHLGMAAEATMKK